jgi:hypothetical protein
MLVFLVLATITIGGTAHPLMAQQVQGNRFTGIVFKVMDSSFVVVDKSGSQSTIKIGSQTTFQLQKQDAGVRDAIKFGMMVRGTVNLEGYADQVTATHLADSMSVAQLKVFLDVTDEEWSLISVKIDQVRAARRAASGNNGNGNNGNGGNGNGNNGNGNVSPPDPNAQTVRALHQALESAYFERAASNDQLAKSVDDLRRERLKAQQNLEAARKDLISILTQKQEALLVILGVLD